MSDSETLRKVREALGLQADSGPTFASRRKRHYREEARHLDSARDAKRIGRLLLAAWADRPCLEITTAVAEDYRDARHQQTTRRGRPPAPATINRELQRARRCLQWAVEQRLLPYNPLATVRMEDEANVRKTKIRTEAELEPILAECDKWLRALVLVCIDCGFRRMEAVTLEWTQLGMVRIKGQPRPVIELWDTKAGRTGSIDASGRRRVGLTDRTFQAIWDLPRAGKYIFCGRLPGRYRSGREAPLRPGSHVNAGAALRKFQRACARAGFKGADDEPVTLHMLRHSAMYRFRVRDRLPERTVMRQLGQKTRAAYDRYGIGDEHESAEMFETVNANIAAELERLTGRKPPRGT